MGELTKWNGGNLPARKTDTDQYVEEWRRKHGLPTVQQPRPQQQQPDYRPPVHVSQKADGLYHVNQQPLRSSPPVVRDQIEILRWCGRRRTAWMAGYILVNGRWKFSGGVEIDALRQRLMYEDRVHDSYQFSSSNYDYEECACCSVTGQGAIHCNVCDIFMCWGSAWQDGPKRWCRCPKCGQDGILTLQDSIQQAIYPKGRGGF